MSLPEIIYRFRQYVQKIYESKRKVRYFPGILHYDFNTRIIEITPDSFEIFPESIDIFGKQLNYMEKINWHLDIHSDREFPGSFSKSIDIRSDKYGSAKTVWEVNRMIYLPWMCMNYRITGNIEYLNKFQAVISDWIEQNPYLIGINWYSNIEVNIRLINWFFCWEILNINSLIKENHTFKTFVIEKWLPLIYLHCKYSFCNPSKYSSANNHLISEYAGLFIASSLWRFPESKRWLAYSKKGLEKEIVRQHSKNGINKEEAAEYIQFITDFFLIAYLTGEYTQNRFSENYQSYLTKIAEYISNFIDSKGNYPRYGDDDDGKVIWFDPDSGFNNFKSILVTTSILTGKYFDISRYYIDNKNKMLLYDKKELLESLKLDLQEEKKTVIYHDEGHAIIRKKNNNREIYIHFDAASLGFLSIAAHGHADALSFILHIDGQPVFIDPGTYTYHTHPEWRQYFISTLAHNTIAVNSSNQAVNKGPTLWTRHYHVKITESSDSDEQVYIKAYHNGYKGIGVIHQRELIFKKNKNLITISDTIEISKKSKFLIEMPFHLHPAVNVKNEDENNFILHINHNRIRLITDRNLKTELVSGKTNPILGWYSPGFYFLTATNTVYCRTNLERTHTFKTEIELFV